MTTTEGIQINWEELLEYHTRRARLYGHSTRLQMFHKKQGQIILLKLTQSGNEAWTWESAIQKAKQMNKKNKPDSRCVECGRPAFAPRGNFNLKRVTLCDSPKCIRERRRVLQKERRKQLKLFAQVKPTQGRRKKQLQEWLKGAGHEHR